MSLSVGDVVWWYCAERDTVRMGEVVVDSDGTQRARPAGGVALSEDGDLLRSSEWLAYMDYAVALEARAQGLRVRASELENLASLARSTADCLRGGR